MVPSYHTTDWSQAKKVTDDNYSWTTRVSGPVFLVEHTNSGGAPERSERFCQRRALQRSQQDVRERKTSVDVLRGRGVQVESGRQLGSLHSGHSGSISHQRLLDMCL